MTDTIFALSSGAVPAAIAVVRISGPGAFAAVERLVGTLPPPRRATLRTIRAAGERLDRALVLIFPGPATATGEDLAELHLHGGRAVVRAVEAALASLPGLRPAEPGEFTRRALANGRIDLTEAEGLADLLAAETEGQRRAALRAAEGSVRQRIEHWAQRVLAASASVEAWLDHADEDDVTSQSDPLAALRVVIDKVASEIEAILAQPPVERLHDGIRIVLAGPPNAGKSTLFNALSGREAAIVSAIPGTTRDRIEAPVMRGGVAYLLIDTAGLREDANDPVEQIGIDRTRAAMAEADLVLWLDDAEPPMEAGLPPHIALHPRCDLSGRTVVPSGRIALSAQNGTGIDAVWQAIAETSTRLLPPPDAVGMNRRQRDLASIATRSLRAAVVEDDPLLLAEELRDALRAFDAITGRAGVEEMLDALFSRFCIGK